eukprot:1160991-Pelagomonas_calceolata.AAC.2
MPWQHCWGIDLELCLFVERVRLLGGPSVGSSSCKPGRLALMVEASPGGVLRASLASGVCHFLRLVVTRLLAYATKWTWSLRASFMEHVDGQAPSVAREFVPFARNDMSFAILADCPSSPLFCPFAAVVGKRCWRWTGMDYHEYLCWPWRVTYHRWFASPLNPVSAEAVPYKAPRDQQAEQSNHLAEGQNPTVALLASPGAAAMACNPCRQIGYMRMLSGKGAILLDVGGTCYTKHTLNQLKQLGLDNQCAIKLARKLHAHSVMYDNKLVTTRHAIENNNTSRSQVMGLGDPNNPPDPHKGLLFVASWWRGLTALLS